MKLPRPLLRMLLEHAQTHAYENISLISCRVRQAQRYQFTRCSFNTYPLANQASASPRVLFSTLICDSTALRRPFRGSNEFPPFVLLRLSLPGSVQLELRTVHDSKLQVAIDAIFGSMLACARSLCVKLFMPNSFNIHTWISLWVSLDIRMPERRVLGKAIM